LQFPAICGTTVGGCAARNFAILNFVPHPLSGVAARETEQAEQQLGDSLDYASR
jgi:hypothetical protein